MSVERKLRRSQARAAAAEVPAAAATPPLAAPADPRRVALGRRVRRTLLLTSFIALGLLHWLEAPVQAVLTAYGVAARVAFLSLLLAPAAFVWILGQGRLRDQA